MVTVKVLDNSPTECIESQVTKTKKRRDRRKKLLTARRALKSKETEHKREKLTSNTVPKKLEVIQGSITKKIKANVQESINNKSIIEEMSTKSRDEVIAAREAKKLTKVKAKNKVTETKGSLNDTQQVKTKSVQTDSSGTEDRSTKPAKDTEPKTIEFKSKDEVDRGIVNDRAEECVKNKEQIKAERAAKKAAKQSKKQGPTKESDLAQAPEVLGKKINKKDENTPTVVPRGEITVKDRNSSVVVVPKDEMTVKDAVETLKHIVNVVKEVKDLTAIVSALDLGTKKPEESAKSKAELKAERRAKQEAQRAAKQAAAEPKAPTIKSETSKQADTTTPKAKELQDKPSNQKTLEKPKAKTPSVNRVNWFQHLYTEHDKEALKNIAINSNLHPDIVKLGVQLSSRVVKGSNARCIALLDALKKMVRDYTLPAKTEFARGLEAYLATSLEFLWSMRQPSASQTNAVKFFRHHLTQLPNNVDEFDAKKTMQEEIDRYIREQIDMAGEAISIAVRKKISDGDNIMTYGCSSLIERILVEAWEAGVKFRTVVVGNRVRRDAAEMLRRLRARSLPCAYVDISALSYLMKCVSKVVVGAGALLANGSVVGAAGAAQVALAARACNVPVLVACETHKFSASVHTDGFVYNEIGDPDDLIDKSDENSPLKDWRSNPNLTVLNLTYDVTPPALVTAVVTELALLPCTSAPVVLRFKLSEYGI